MLFMSTVCSVLTSSPPIPAAYHPRSSTQCLDGNETHPSQQYGGSPHSPYGAPEETPCLEQPGFAIFIAHHPHTSAVIMPPRMYISTTVVNSSPHSLSGIPGGSPCLEQPGR